MRLRKLLLVFLVLSVIAGGGGAAQAEGSPEAGQVELRVLGYNQWRAGGPVSLRVIAYDARNARGVADVAVDITVQQPDSKRPALTAKGTTNEQGTLDAQLKVPRQSRRARDPEGDRGADAAARDHGANPQGAAALPHHRQAALPARADHRRPHARAARAVPDAVANTAVTLEIEDAKANKVFKQRGSTNRFGVVSAKFELATEVNMGEYHVRCTLGDGATSAEKSVTVKRYVLPKFKISVKPEKAWYMPSETIKGTVKADYFFGKPVANAKVAIEARTFDTDTRVVGTINGTTNATGSYQFEMKLPDYFVDSRSTRARPPSACRCASWTARSTARSRARRWPWYRSPSASRCFRRAGTSSPGCRTESTSSPPIPTGRPRRPAFS